MVPKSNKTPEHLRATALCMCVHSAEKMQADSRVHGGPFSAVEAQLPSLLLDALQYWKVPEGGTLVPTPDTGLSLTIQTKLLWKSLSE